MAVEIVLLIVGAVVIGAFIAGLQKDLDDAESTTERWKKDNE